MAKLLINRTNSQTSVIFDTDVVINWLTKEVETAAGRDLWKIPHKIVSLVEKKKIRGMISLTTLLEVRYLLRRKKKYTPPRIKFDTKIPVSLPSSF